MPWLVRFFLLLLIFVGAASVRAAAQATTPAKEDRETEPVVRALCGKRVALLGESPVHGFGEALKFKVEVVRRLVDECHYNALFWESGTYDYINIGRKVDSGQELTSAMISAAIGGVWANKEVQPLVPFLREKVMAGSLTLGGLDDQIGAGSYASREMASDLVQALRGDERSRCFAILQKHMRWQYTDDAPYGPPDKTKIVGCLDEIEDHLSQPGESKKSRAEEDKAMIDSFKRELARDFTEDDWTKSDQKLKWWNDRDRSMYLNFEWLFSRLPRNSKVIVWAATVHVAKDLSGITGFEGETPFGSYVRREFGDQAFALGFSAYSGGYEFIHPPVKELSAAPVSTLEGQVFTQRDSDTIYLSREQLQKRGAIAARLLGTDFKMAHWDRVVDGLVVFRKERAPSWLNPR